MDLPDEPVGVALPSSTRPDVAGGLAVNVQPVMMPAMDGGPDHSEDGVEPVLLVTVAVTEDHGQGAAPWLSELELAVWRPAGFSELFTADMAEDGWSARAIRGYPL